MNIRASQGRIVVRDQPAPDVSTLQTLHHQLLGLGILRILEYVRDRGRSSLGVVGRGDLGGTLPVLSTRDDNEVGIRETWLDALQECFHSFSPVTGQTRVEFRPAFR